MLDMMAGGRKRLREGKGTIAQSGAGTRWVVYRARRARRDRGALQRSSSAKGAVVGRVCSSTGNSHPSCLFPSTDVLLWRSNSHVWWPGKRLILLRSSGARSALAVAHAGGGRGQQRAIKSWDQRADFVATNSRSPPRDVLASNAIETSASRLISHPASPPPPAAIVSTTTAARPPRAYSFPSPARPFSGIPRAATNDTRQHANFFCVGFIMRLQEPVFRRSRFH